MGWSRHIFSRALVGGAFLVALGGGVTLLHLRAAQSKVVGAHRLTPIPVAGVILKEADGYDVIDRFVGRLEPAQQSQISFERSGLIVSVLVEEGQRVEQGEMIAILDTASLKADRDRLNGERRQKTARLELAQLTENRKRLLYGKDHISQQKLDEARLNTAVKRGELDSINAIIRKIDIDIGKSVLRAPFSGVVGARLIDTGVVVAAGTSIIELLQSGQPQARIGVSPEAAAQLRIAAALNLISGGKRIAGRVVAIRPDVSTATQTIGVLVDLIEAPTRLFGDTIELHLKRHIKAQGFWLPLSALNEGERGLWTVLTLKTDRGGTLSVGREAVELLHSETDRVFVRGTLRAGQSIIARGRNRIIPGQLVSLAPMKEARP